MVDGNEEGYDMECSWESIDTSSLSYGFVAVICRLMKKKVHSLHPSSLLASTMAPSWYGSIVGTARTEALSDVLPATNSFIGLRPLLQGMLSEEGAFQHFDCNEDTITFYAS